MYIDRRRQGFEFGGKPFYGQIWGELFAFLAKFRVLR